MNYFTMNFALMQHHKYSLTEIENMIPWEREIYTSLLADHVQKENERIEQMNQSGAQWSMVVHGGPLKAKSGRVSQSVQSTVFALCKTNVYYERKAGMYRLTLSEKRVCIDEWFI